MRSEDLIWVCLDGRKLYLGDMENNHLKNTATTLERNKERSYERWRRELDQSPFAAMVVEALSDCRSAGEYLCLHTPYLNILEVMENRAVAVEEQLAQMFCDDEPVECPICSKPFFNVRCTGCGYDNVDREKTLDDIFANMGVRVVDVTPKCNCGCNGHPNDCCDESYSPDHVNSLGHVS